MKASGWLVLFAACAGGSGTGGSRTPEGSVAPEGPTRIGVSLGAFEPLDIALEADGMRRFARDGVRGIRHADGRGEWADDVTVAAIRGAARAPDGGWLFLDADDALWRAPTFLGPLTFAGRAEGGIGHSVRSPGRIALVDPGAYPGDLQVIDAEGHLSRVPGLPDASVMSAAFLDERTGAVVLDGGFLQRTEDAGATWQAVPAETVTEVAAEGDGWRATFVERAEPSRSYPVSRSGGVGPTGESAPDEREFAWRRDDVALAAHLRLLNLAVPVLAGVGVLPGESHEGSAGRDVRLLSLDTGEVETVPGARPAGDCPMVTWGAAVAALCRTAHGIELHRSTDGRRWTRVPGGAIPVPADDLQGVPINLSPDGRRAVWAGPCRGTPDPTRSCLLSDARRGHRVELPLTLGDDSVVIDGPAGDWLLGETNDPGGASTVWAFHVGRHERVTIGARADGESLRLTDDGLLVHVTAVPNAPSRVTIGPPGGAARAIALPAGALTAGFADASRGIAAGTTLDRLWRTLDGGRRWERLPVPVEGDASRVRTLSDHDFDGVVCFARRCVVARGTADVPLVAARIVIDGWGAIAPREGRLMVAPPPAAPPAPRPPTPRDELASPSLTCTIPGTPPPRPPAGARDPQRVELPFGAGAAHGKVRIHADGAAATADVDWSGSDARGRYHSISPAAALSWLQMDDVREPDIFHVYSVTRAGVLFFLCGGGDCELLYAPRSGVVRSLAHQTYEGGIAYEPFLARPDPDGGAMLIGTEGRTSHLAPDGTMTPVRRIATPFSRLGIGHDGTRPVVVARPTYGLARFRAYGLEGGSIPRNLATRTAMAPCRAPRPAGAIEVVMNGGAELESPQWNVPRELTTTLEVDERTACLRAVDIWSTETGRDVLGAHVVAGADGALTGTAWTTAGREVPMRCAATE